MLTIDNLSCRLGDFSLQDATFSIERGDYFVLLGESGAGKTVILELIMGLLQPMSGRILLEKRDLARVPIQHRDIGLVYQDNSLFPHMSVSQNIAYSLASSEQSCIQLLAEEVGAAHLLGRMPNTLSLGEAQRVALARTLARRPKILLLDEPLASLDVQSRVAVRSLLRRINASGQTIMHVTHDYEEAVALANRVAVLEGGKIVQVGTPDEVFHHPRSRFIAEFVGIKNFFRGQIEGSGDSTVFCTCGLRFSIFPGCSGSGSIVFESKMVTVSLQQPHSNECNVFRGVITEIEPMPSGFEITVNIGENIYALISRASMDQMGIRVGRKIWINFKSTDIHFIADGEIS